MSDPAAVPGGELGCGGVPPVGEVRLSPPSPARFAIRPDGIGGSELFLAIAGHERILPLDYPRLIGLLEDITAALGRCDETR